MAQYKIENGIATFINEGITKIEAYAFAGSDDVIRINIPQNVT